MNDSRKSIRVLVAPLDWGLGHTTRCIPIIGQLLQNGCEVVLAAEGASARLLAREFPQLELKSLEGYRIRYGKNNFFFNILLQLPGIFRSITKERKWLEHLLSTEKFDIIISDNRPGLHSNNAYCVYITHQLRIQSGISSWLNDRLQQLHTRYMKKFNKVWVPDASSDDHNLAGKLSHPAKQRLAVDYLGLLSRFRTKGHTPKTYDLMCLLSGPEPQRSLLEQQCVEELKQFQGKALLVRGLPGDTSALSVSNNIKVEQHLNAAELQAAIEESTLVICRSGYTTLMDLMKLKQKAVLIPTPGQTEQEYLAAYMQASNYFPYLLQKDFSLKEAFHLSQQFSYTHPFDIKDFEHYREVVDELITRISKS